MRRARHVWRVSGARESGDERLAAVSRNIEREFFEARSFRKSHSRPDLARRILYTCRKRESKEGEPVAEQRERKGRGAEGKGRGTARALTSPKKTRVNENRVVGVEARWWSFRARAIRRSLRRNSFFSSSHRRILSFSLRPRVP